jgi:hypothetical protein
VKAAIQEYLFRVLNSAGGRLMNFKKIGSITVVAFAMTIITPGIYSQAKDENGGMQGHDVVRPSDLKWTPIMKGCSLAKVSGDPDGDGTPFVVRIRCTAGSKIPAHWHPTDENVTVLRGTFMVGAGETFDATTMKTMEPGSFMSVPKEMRHYALNKTATVLQLHGAGPFKVNWVNPSEVLPPDAPVAAKPKG